MNNFIINNNDQTDESTNLTSSSEISSGNSLTANTEHLLYFLIYLSAPYLQIPIHSPIVSP